MQLTQPTPKFIRTVYECEQSRTANASGFQTSDVRHSARREKSLKNAPDHPGSRSWNSRGGRISKTKRAIA